MKKFLLIYSILLVVLFNSLFCVYTEPTIWVSDINFGMVKSGKKTTRTFQILNNGCEQLVITGINQTVITNDFTLDPNLYLIDSLHPLIIPPYGSSSKFNVEFNPSSFGSHIGEVLFISNAGKIYDDTLKLKGIVVQPGLLVNSYNWRRVRIHREKFPAGPYGNTYIYGQPQAILLENTGTQEVRIDKVDVNVIKGDKTAFLYKESDLTVVIQPGEKKLVDIKFQPTSVGEHEIELVFSNTLGTEVRSNLKGIGTVPKLSTYIEDFGSSIVGSKDMKTKKVRINNLNHDWADNLTITDFIVEPQQAAISENLSGFGSEGFRYDKVTIFKTKPEEKVVLRPCETLEFDADFMAQKEGSHHARLKTVSDAEEEGVSVWIGLGIIESGVEDCKCKLNISIRPNPVVNNEVSLHFTLFEYNFTVVRIFNLMGQLVQVPFSGELGTGEHDIRIDTRDLTTGMYNVQIRTGKYFVTRNLVIIR